MGTPQFRQNVHFLMRFLRYDEVGFCSLYQNRFVSQNCNGNTTGCCRFANFRKFRKRSIFSDLMNLDFTCDVQVEVSEFGANDIKMDLFYIVATVQAAAAGGGGVS